MASKPTSPPHGLFWPNFILLVAVCAFLVCQILSLKYQLGVVNRGITRAEDKVSHARFVKGKVVALAQDVVRLAPHDPSAEEIAKELKLDQLLATEPVVPDIAQEQMPTSNTASQQENLSRGTNVTPADTPGAGR
jgi:hypothetical protein